MFKNVLIGVDDGGGGRDAVALARRLNASEADLTLGHIYPGDPGASDHRSDEEQARGEDLFGAIAGDLGPGAVVRCRGSSSVGRGLHELSEAIGADLLVVGSSRRGRLGRVLLGDDTRAALNGAPCAVAVAPDDYAYDPGLIREIGVGYNGSHESVHALDVARGLAAETGAKLSAFQAVYGRAAEELAIFSASVDLLVVGSRGYGPVGRLVHGSTSQQLARISRCPLLVLTRAARGRARPLVEQDDERVDAICLLPNACLQASKSSASSSWGSSRTSSAPIPRRRSSRGISRSPTKASRSESAGTASARS
jgi:nucleotide-binding universal stress UspA family protein